MSFSTPDLSDENPDAQALAPILQNLGGKKVFWGKIETLKCPDDNSYVKELLNSDGDGKVLVVDADGISTVALRLSPGACRNGTAGLAMMDSNPSGLEYCDSIYVPMTLSLWDIDL